MKEINTKGCIKTSNHCFLANLMTGIARRLKFESASDMLYILYCEDRLSLATIQRMTGMDRGAITRYIRILGGRVRGVGGPNNLANRSGLLQALCADNKRRVFLTECFDPGTQTARLVYCRSCGAVLSLGARSVDAVRPALRRHVCPLSRRENSSLKALSKEEE